jgi:hypothetical protein
MQVSNKNKVSVVDLDGTLFLHTFFTRLFFGVSKFFHRLALISEKLNPIVANEIRGTTIVVLSGRSYKDWDIFENKLSQAKLGCEWAELYDRDTLVKQWKREAITNLRREFGQLTWYDDEKEEIWPK